MADEKVLKEEQSEKVTGGSKVCGEELLGPKGRRKRTAPAKREELVKDTLASPLSLASTGLADNLALVDTLADGLADDLALVDKKRP